MSALSLMEWNAKHPMQWDWENLIMLNSSAENNVKKMQSVPDWEIDDGEKGIDSGGGGSLYSSGSGGSGSGSDLGLARSFSKSSKSASINSSSIGDVRMSNFSLEDSDAILEDSSNKNVYTAKANGGSSAALEGCVGSGEPLLGLKLGKRTYFEDVCAGSNTKTTSSTSFSVIPGSSVSPTKKSKASSQASPAPRCQVEGCNLDLSSAKDYHRKHRVCESHSKCPKVIVAGLERRFCQQCSRFHGLSEFDEKKRSCRRRLSDHNARRRKPQPDSIQLNPSRLSSSLYDERQPMNLVWDRAPIVHARSSASLTWEGTSTPKFTITKEYVPKPPKIRDIDRQYHLTDNELTSIPMHPHNSKSLLPSKAKVTTVEALNQGLEDSITTTVDATHDLQRALSLLSTNSWNSCEPKSISHEQSAQTSHTGMPHSVLQSMPQSLPVSSSDYWRSEQPTTSSRVHNLASQNDSGSYFQEYQLFRSPYDSDFYPSQLN